MIIKRSSLCSLYLGIVLFSGPLLHSAMSQITQNPQPIPSGQQKDHVISIEHYYWHFLVHLSQVDHLAAPQEAKRKGGNGTQTPLYKKLGLSDADYASIRISSMRLTAKLKTLDAQASAIAASQNASSRHVQLQSINTRREAAINAEVSYLRRTLSPNKITTLETHMVQFFTPPGATPVPSSVSGQVSPTAVQK